MRNATFLRTMSGFRSNRQRFLALVSVLTCVGILVVGGVRQSEQWEARPPDEWSRHSVGWLLLESPWVSLQRILVLRRPFRSAEVRSQPIHINFLWLSRPVLEALDRAQVILNRKIDFTQFTNLGKYFSDLRMLIPAHRELKQHFENLGATLNDRDSIRVLISSPHLPEVIRTGRGAPVQEAFLRNETGAGVRSKTMLYGFNRMNYSRSGRGVNRAVIDVEILKKQSAVGDDRRVPADTAPPSFSTVFTGKFPNFEDIRWVLLIFPREIAGRSLDSFSPGKITVEVPVGDKSLRTTFKIDEMVFNGEIQY